MSNKEVGLRAMRLLHSSVVLLLMLPGLPLLAASSVVNAPHVRIELLVPENNLHNSGRLNDAGLYFKLEPGWHIYWKNPGDADEPPHIHWTLPDGIAAGPIEFPAPSRLPLGSLMDYGYEDEVLFPLKLRVAKGVKAGPIILRAAADWLVCQNSCIPGSAELEVQRSVDTAPYNLTYKPDPLFKRFFDRLPRSLPGKANPVFQPTKEGFRLTVETGRRETGAIFFPADPDILDNPAPQKFTPTAKGLILDLKKDAGLSANPKQLKGVLELSGGRAFELTALSSQAPQPSSPVSAAAPASHPRTFSPAPGPSRSGLAEKLPFSWATLLRASAWAFLGGILLNLMPCVFFVCSQRTRLRSQDDLS